MSDRNDSLDAIPYRTPACNDHLDQQDDDVCPWCRIEELEKALDEERYARKMYQDSAEKKIRGLQEKIQQAGNYLAQNISMHSPTYVFNALWALKGKGDGENS